MGGENTDSDNEEDNTGNDTAGGTANSSPTPDGDEMTSTDDETPIPEAEREEMVEQLPEPSPLADVLVNLFKADDREGFAQEHDLNYQDRTVQVDISLEPDSDLPVEYLPDDRTVYGDTVIAYVDVHSLVDLALDERVRLVAPYMEPQTHL
jgi:hypothetical protein